MTTNNDQKVYVGGQAVIDGVMMKNKHKIAIAVRKPDRSIKVKKDKFISLTEKYKIFNLPFVRGIFNLIEMMVLGTKALTYSTNESLEEDDEKISLWELAITIVISFAFAFGLFYLLPLVITSLFKFLDGIWFNIVDGIIRIIFVLAYIWLIGLIKDIKRVFQYHGAEHKSVNCFEAGHSLNPKNCQKFSTIHPRCGTSFIFIVLIISIIVFSIFHYEAFWAKFISRILLLPVIAGISYEFLKFSADRYNNKLMKLLIAPGLFMQKLTTREPNEKQLEVAIKALKATL